MPTRLQAILLGAALTVGAAASQVSGNAEALLQKAIQAETVDGDLEAAIRPYELLLENDPGNVNAWERLADLYEINKMPNKAQEAKARVKELKNL